MSASSGCSAARKTGGSRLHRLWLRAHPRPRPLDPSAGNRPSRRWPRHPHPALQRRPRARPALRASRRRRALAASDSRRATGPDRAARRVRRDGAGRCRRSGRPPAFGEEEGTAEAAGPNCSEEPRRSSVVSGGSHPPKRWYEPGEEAPVSLFNHILLDGYVIVTYKPELPEADRDALEDWILERDIIVAARPEPGQEDMLVAATVRTELTCSELDIAALTAFREQWFETRPTE